MDWLTYELAKDHIDRLRQGAQQARRHPRSDAAQETSTRLGAPVVTWWRRLMGLPVLASVRTDPRRASGDHRVVVTRGA